MTSAGARIHLEKIGFAYQGASAWTLGGVTARVEPGEELWVTGDNASGKSTLLGVLSGVIPEVIEGTLSGSAEIRTADGGQALPSMVMQDAGVYLFRSVADEISFVLQNRGIPPEDVSAETVAALDVLGIAHLEQRLMHTLSGGERQKVAVAAALAVAPDLLLLDEPFEQLDPAAAARTLEVARGLAARGVTLVVATRHAAHVPADARELHLVAGRVGERPAARPVPASRVPRALGETVLAIDAVSFRYPGGAGISDVSLTVREGEAVALLGPNGAGKTTLMKHVNGLLRPSAGSVSVRGIDIAKLPVWQVARDVGLLFQNPDDQIFNRRVDLEVAWGLTVRGASKADALAQAHAALEELGIAHLAEENPHEITASQRQLVAFASIFVTCPRLYVLDEPTKALDADAAEVVAAAMDRRLAEGAGVLLVTHDLAFAARLADRTVVMTDGALLA